MDDLEHYGRRQCLRLYGLHVAEKETADDVLVKMKGVVSKLGVEMPDSAYDRAHRIGRIYKDDKVSLLVVTFVLTFLSAIRTHLSFPITAIEVVHLS